jgi:hypothetical protein
MIAATPALPTGVGVTPLGSGVGVFGIEEGGGVPVPLDEPPFEQAATPFRATRMPRATQALR